MVFNFQRHPVVFGTGTKDARQPEWSIEQLKDAFKRFDKDNDGQLSKDELREAFNYLGSRCSRYRGFVARYHADKNKDGLINLNSDEFTILVKYAHSRGYQVVDK